MREKEPIPSATPKNNEKIEIAASLIPININTNCVEEPKQTPRLGVKENEVGGSYRLEPDSPGDVQDRSDHDGSVTQLQSNQKSVSNTHSQQKSESEENVNKDSCNPLPKKDNHPEQLEINDSISLHVSVQSNTRSAKKFESSNGNASDHDNLSHKSIKQDSSLKKASQHVISTHELSEKQSEHANSEYTKELDAKSNPQRSSELKNESMCAESDKEEEDTDSVHISDDEDDHQNVVDSEDHKENVSSNKGTFSYQSKKLSNEASEQRVSKQPRSNNKDDSWSQSQNDSFSKGLLEDSQTQNKDDIDTFSNNNEEESKYVSSSPQESDEESDNLLVGIHQHKSKEVLVPVNTIDKLHNQQDKGNMYFDENVIKNTDNDSEQFSFDHTQVNVVDEKNTSKVVSDDRKSNNIIKLKSSSSSSQHQQIKMKNGESRECEEEQQSDKYEQLLSWANESKEHISTTIKSSQANRYIESIFKNALGNSQSESSDKQSISERSTSEMGKEQAKVAGNTIDVHKREETLFDHK